MPTEEKKKIVKANNHDANHAAGEINGNIDIEEDDWSLSDEEIETTQKAIKKIKARQERLSRLRGDFKLMALKERHKNKQARTTEDLLRKLDIK
jgi:hypothetical protein